MVEKHVTPRWGYHTITWRNNLAQACRDIAQAGFQGIEAFSFQPLPGEAWHPYLTRLIGVYQRDPRTHHLVTARKLQELLPRFNLRLASLYCSGEFINPASWPKEVEALTAVAEFLHAMGSRQMVVGGGMNVQQTYSTEDYKQLAITLEQVGKQCQRLGMELCYHPHSGTMVENQTQLRQFCAMTDPALVFLALDVAHLARGGMDPAETLFHYRERLRYVHLKDLKEGEFVELGEGELNLPAVFEVLRHIAYQGWLIVELDDTLRTPLQSALLSRSYVEEKLGLRMGP